MSVSGASKILKSSSVSLEVVLVVLGRGLVPRVSFPAVPVSFQEAQVVFPVVKVDLVGPADVKLRRSV